MVVVGVLIIAGGIVVFNNYGSSSDQTAGAGGAFDELGYNRTARIFNGTGANQRVCRQTASVFILLTNS